jgi:hypothetical protein
LKKNKKFLKEEILTYLNTHSRYKVVFHSTPVDDLQSHNVGVLLAEAIKEIKDDNRLSLKASILIDEILNSCKESHPDYGEILAIENIGILLEPELKIDVQYLIQNNSVNNTLFVQWEGNIENNILYFLSKEQGIEINIQNLNYIEI